MTVNAIIKSTLDPFGDEVQAGEYIGKADRYYTFNYSIIGGDFGDDAPGHERYIVQVHFICPRTFNSVAQIQQTKQRLYAAGFTWPNVTNASDADGQHIVFECETAEEANVDGNGID